jgi:hypothetical protein
MKLTPLMTLAEYILFLVLGGINSTLDNLVNFSIEFQCARDLDGGDSLGSSELGLV